MKRIIIDTNFYVAFKQNDGSAVNLLKQAEFIGINATVLGELISGFRCGSKFEQNSRELDFFLDSPRVNVLEIDDKTAEFYAAIYYDLRQKGTPIPSNDIWLAASAMQHGLALATFDAHFAHISGLLPAQKM